MEYIITFSSTNQAILSEGLLLESQIDVKVMPLPPKIKAGCGICLRIPDNSITQALQVLNGKSEYDGVYKKQSDENGTYFETVVEL